MRPMPRGGPWYAKSVSTPLQRAKEYNPDVYSLPRGDQRPEYMSVRRVAWIKCAASSDKREERHRSVRKHGHISFALCKGGAILLANRASPYSQGINKAGSSLYGE
jgi:hypothetical protein